MLYLTYVISSPILTGMISGLLSAKLRTNWLRLVIGTLLPIPLLLCAILVYTKTAREMYGYRDAHIPIEIFIMPLIAIPLSLYYSNKKKKT